LIIFKEKEELGRGTGLTGGTSAWLVLLRARSKVVLGVVSLCVVVEARPGALGWS
jgi:hypothetical protein